MHAVYTDKTTTGLMRQIAQTLMFATCQSDGIVTVYFSALIFYAIGVGLGTMSPKGSDRRDFLHKKGIRK